MIQLNKYLDNLRGVIKEVDVQTAYKQQQQGAVLLDIREKDEVNSGSPKDGIRISKGMLEMNIANEVPSDETPVYLLCASGRRSLVSAFALLQLGYKHIYSVKGGFTEWKNQGLPFETPKRLNEEDLERYKRHLLIPEIGEKGQMKLLNSRVLIVGAGGIGSPVAWYLAAAGVGKIGIIDDDVVDRTNLQRQILHTENSVGTSKVDSAKERLEALNPKISIVPIKQRLTAENIEGLFADYDLILDGTDNFNTRYLINDACVKLKKPNVHGSVFRFEGQISTFWPDFKAENTPCYRCVYPTPPPPELAPSCAEAGVLGVLPGMVGVMCATEAIKILVGFGNLMVGKLLSFNALTWEFDIYDIDQKKDCAYCSCQDESQYPHYEDYLQACTL